MASQNEFNPHDPVSNEDPVADPVQGGGDAPVDLDADLSDLTLRDLIAILRRELLATEGAAGGLERAALEGDFPAERSWKDAQEAVALIGPSPVDVQVCFLEGLVSHPDEAERFLEDPAGYAKQAGVLLDPALVRDIVDVAVFGADLEKRLGGQVSPGALRDIAHIRQRPIAGVVSGAAASAAAAAFAVTAAMEKASISDVARMKGIDAHGVRLPGGRFLRTPRDVATAVVVSNNAVAVYATTAVASGAASVVASDRLGLAALRGSQGLIKTPKK